MIKRDQEARRRGCFGAAKAALKRSRSASDSLVSTGPRARDDQCTQTMASNVAAAGTPSHASTPMRTSVGGGLVAGTYPLVLTVRKLLPLPQRNLGLYPVDQQPADPECLITVVATRRHDHGNVADLELADPVDRG